MSFVEFLGRARHIGDQIEALSKEIEEAERKIKASAYIDQGSLTTSSTLESLSKSFFARAKNFKHQIEDLSSEATDKKREYHITSLFKRLSSQIDRFYTVRSMGLLIKSGNNSDEEEAEVTAIPLTAQSRTESIQGIMKNMTSLEALSIELNIIIDSTGDVLDKVSIKSTETKNISETANKVITAGIAKRKRRRRFKQVFMALLLIFSVLAGAYFGTRILELFIKFREAIH